ncbi:relaxase/mobilization nuclease domain-containing protein [Phaeobacter sp. 11ANDIMAR09]|uniref:relaxase/mobilization nuclease domain-containing protein n=1 Tax=Phaeobacter sp. 11ANDIMAR09 TaxID=1225647 RepID=UPI0006C838A4|nr:relaxase/mobilization nuclease domain-containing protein [Phaeobacter sp. 11ANDIMAR09]KPD13153.1 relaxase [Phaeobacter sp. 11ANDIMAR09]
MIIKASQRSGAVALADHLMNDRDNDHVDVIDIDGFVADDLHGAFKEAYAISKATQCNQFLFSVSLNPPEHAVATDDDFRDTASRVADAVGLSDQPHAIVVHEKNGRRHAHAVWSRIDGVELKAINLPHYKNKLRDVSRDLFLDHGWILPDGLATYGNKSPLNFTLEEWQQAKRQNLDPREIKQTFQNAWDRSDNQTSFKNALEERGYFLARGDRRGFVALDVDGNVHAIAKWTGVKSKDVKAKLGSPEDLHSVDETKSQIRSKVSSQMRDFIAKAKNRHSTEMHPLREEVTSMARAHRQERKTLKEGQAKRWADETKVRSLRLNGGLRGLLDKVTGKSKATRQQNEREALKAAKRDQQQRDFMIREQMKERQKLQGWINKLKIKQRAERQNLARDIASILRPKLRPETIKQQQPNLVMQPATRPRRDRGPSFTP